MISKNNQPSARQIRWREVVRAYGPIVPGMGPVQVHHVVGRSRQIRLGLERVHIGHWFLLPLPWSLHDVHSNNPLNITHHRKAFVAEYGDEVSLFLKMVEEIQRPELGLLSLLPDGIPFGQTVLDAIQQTRSNHGAF